MRAFRFNSIRYEILLFGAIALLIVSIAIIAYAGSTQYSASVQSSIRDVKGISIEQAGELKASLEKALLIDKTIAQSLTGSFTSGNKPSREQVQAMVQGLMVENPDYNGIYIVWEPDSWDGKDSEYIGKPGTDESGAFMAYYSRDAQGTPIIDHVYNYHEGEEGSEFYQIPKKTLRDVVTQPFPWDIQGRKILLSSIVAPIIINNTFFGISGIDVPLDNIQGFANAIDSYNKTTKMYIISYEGVVTGATGYDESISKNLKDAGLPFSGDAETVLTRIQAGENSVTETGGEIIAFTPVYSGNSDKPWSVIITVPTDVATAQARTNLYTLILIGAICAIIGLTILYLAARGITRPIEEITNYADSIAEGDLMHEVNIIRSDEIGRLADAFRRMLNNLQGKAQAADGIAAGDLSVRIPVVSDQDTLGSSMVTMENTIRLMAETVNNLADRATEGELMVRGDPSQYQGEFKKIITGINATLDAVIHPINGAMDLAGVYATGDYTARFDPKISVSGAFVPFRDALNRIGEQSGSAVREVKGQIESVVSGVQETTASVQEVSASSGKLAESSTQVSSLADTSLKGVSQILAAMNDLSMNINHVAEMTDNVASISHTTDDLSIKGAKLAKQAEEGMQQIISSIEESSTTMTGMAEQMTQIGQIVNLISEIADQTNLLALNAAIEAARAGDAGRGFAVVAEEVKALAVESQHSAEKIGAMISTLQKQSGIASESMNRSSHEVQIGNETVRETLEVFSLIVKEIQAISENTATVAAAAEEQAAAVEEVTASVHELESHVVKTAEEAIASAAATEETSAALDQISRSISSVAAASERINQEMGRFKV
ncbi:MAG TPA: methyl-accepting chemotaxis protein [Methanospirillum sp.]|nr:methyl-accepting chemotaxis protein [Methanospirillum sp.]